MEYYIYNVKNDGFEDLMWYTESPDEVTKAEAIKKLNELARRHSEIHYRLWGIDRTQPVPNKRELIREYTGAWVCSHDISHKDNQYCPICLKKAVAAE